MERFARLYSELDESNRTAEKVAALERYFREAPPADAAWAAWFLAGNRPPRAVSSTLLRRWVAEETGLPEWMVEECHDSVGDLAETVELLVARGGARAGEAPPLAQLVEEHLLPLRAMEEDERRAAVVAMWGRLGPGALFVWHKMMLGGFRVGVSRTLVARALAAVAGVEQAEMAHRLMGFDTPTAERFGALIAGAAPTAGAQPYPFCLAHALEGPVEALGPVEEWQAEWKWDGIRAQILRRGGEVLVWSRGEELVTDQFPEVAAAAARLAPGTVLDGEILCWRDGAPLPFQSLQSRINRRVVSRRLLAEAPVVYTAYDVLELGGRDLRGEPLSTRRALLEEVVAAAGGDDGGVLRVSPLVAAADWGELARLRGESRGRGVEGLMLKRRDSVYTVGRVRGAWWKWKIEPFTMDAVLVYAQKGHGRRANLFTDYTFAVWQDGALVPVAKAYSGLTDEEIRRVDAWIRRHTVERHGPVRVVEPGLVFEIAFEGIQESRRHRSGLAVRFPRMARWRTDKTPAEADTVDRLRALMGAGAESGDVGGDGDFPRPWGAGGAE